jgi:hypothetical protein
MRRKRPHFPELEGTTGEGAPSMRGSSPRASYSHVRAAG